MSQIKTNTGYKANINGLPIETGDGAKGGQLNTLHQKSYNYTYILNMLNEKTGL